MPQWKSNANTTGAPKWGASILQQGSGATAKAANNTALVANVTAGSFKAHGVALNEVNGIFPITPQAKANTSGESGKVHGLGWALRTAGEGPLISAAAANGGSYSNGDTVLVTGGTVNAIMTVTTNSGGNLVSAAVVAANVGLFPNTSAPVFTMTKEKHVVKLNFANSVTLGANVGNANTIVVTVSNTGNLAIYNAAIAVGSFVSNSANGWTNTDIQGTNIVWAGANGSANAFYWGRFSNNQVNTAVIITFANANGSPISNQASYTASANLAIPTGTAVVNGPTLGGRAGRVTYEMLVIDRHINTTATSSVSNSTYLPET